MRRLLFVGIVLFIAILFITSSRKSEVIQEPIVVTVVVMSSPVPVSDSMKTTVAQALITATETAVPPSHTPTSTPTPTLTTQILVDDHFDEEFIYAGSGEDGIADPEIKQIDSVLEVQFSDKGTAHVSRVDNPPVFWEPGMFFFSESEISLSSESQSENGADGKFIMNIWLPFENDNFGIYIDCFLTRGESVKVECIKALWDISSGKNVDEEVISFFTQTAAYDTWYKFRTELDGGGKMTVFLDRVQIGSYQMTDAEISEVTKIYSSYKISSSEPDTIMGYVDNVRVGYMDPIAAVLQKLGFDPESGQMVIEPNQEPITIVFTHQNNGDAAGDFGFPNILPDVFVAHIPIEWGGDDDQCQVYYRINEGDKNYHVSITRSSQIYVGKVDDKWNELWRLETNELDPNNSNKLIIVAHGNEYEVYVNGFQNPIKTFTDDAYSNGKMSLVGWNPVTGNIGDSSCTFKDVWVWAPDS
ncbi:MAG: hypothetical protein DWQ04_15295 [Chloroflexi bacterium]|nr:MAG: hypothetical protein DWQ04_15295 [Chloroflexota bacterium]